jgi:hypothetical protein
MASLFETVQQFFANEGWPTARLQTAEPSLRMDYQGKHAAWPCVARVREEQGHITFYSVSKLAAPTERRAQITELLTRVNFGLIVGNFEVDMDVGEIRFRTNLDLGAPEVDAATFPKLFGRMVGTNLHMMDQHTPAIQAVLDGDAPEQALARLREAG